MRKKMAFLVALAGLLLIPKPSFAVEDLRQDPNLTAVRTNPLAEEAVESIRSQFETLRINETDFKLPKGWELPFTIPAVESFFNEPLNIPRKSSVWLDMAEQAAKKSDLFNVALDILDVKPGPPIKVIRDDVTLSARIPQALKPAIRNLAVAFARVQPLLDKAVDSVSPEVRAGFLSAVEWPDPDTGAIRQEISARRMIREFEGMSAFPQDDMLKSAAVLFKALDKSIEQLEALDLAKLPIQNRIRWQTPHGIFMIGGAGDDTYNRDDLKNVALLIDLGGKNTYLAPTAAALAKEIRVTIDFGTDVTVKAPDDIRGNAGTGVFGIGVMVLPNSKGAKSMQTGPFSQGVGVAGVGALFIDGPADLVADRNVQGMGVFGVGILSAKNGAASTYVASRSGQGAGSTRGVGIFVHSGDQANIKGGLVQPDPREPLGSVSLCQGVGMGPRAYTGGGVGLAALKGDKIMVTGSYFSQGVGYWHALGAFRLRGNSGVLQARRYDMGSGVHSAFGHFDVYGNSNRILNWGVGPSYGWDHSAGSSLIQGDDNEMQTEWGSGTASIGSLSFSYYKSNRGRLKLCDYGTNNFFRDEPSYSIQLIQGMDNQLACHGSSVTAPSQKLRRMRSPWGMFQIEGVELKNELTLAPAQWEEPRRTETLQREMADLGARIKQAQEKSPLEEVSDLVDISAAFSVDKKTPREAQLRLLTLPPKKVPYLIDVLEPAAIDQLIQLNISIPAHGDTLTRLILKNLDALKLQKKANFISTLRMGRPSTVIPALLEMQSKPGNQALRGPIVRTLGKMLNKDRAREPGARAALMVLEERLTSPGSKEKRVAAQTLLKDLPYGESFGLLATVCDLDNELRERFFAAAPADLTAALGPSGADAFLTIVSLERKKNLEIVKRELGALESAESGVRKLAHEMLISTNAAITASAVITLGHIAHADDAAALEKYLTHANTSVRESAAVALARIGDPALPVLTHVLESGAPKSRALIMAGVSQTSSPKMVSILEKGLSDPDATVRLTALSVLDNLPPALQPKRQKLIEFAARKLIDDPDLEVHLAVQLLK